MKKRKEFKRSITIAVAILCMFFAPTEMLSASEIDDPSDVLIYVTQSGGVATTGGSVIDNHEIYNRVVADNKLPTQSRQADLLDRGNPQNPSGHGIKIEQDGIGQGMTLSQMAHTCMDFNDNMLWASKSAKKRHIWRDSYAGWGAFAVNDGGFYKSDGVLFSLEQSVGPGRNFGSDEYSVKISNNQPYAAGFGSPIFSVASGSTVTIRIRYMIFDHDVLGQDYDWVSLGIKADARAEGASYQNGYTRGRWAELEHTVVAGESGEIMIMIQAQSPVALNSNIYFDDIQVSVDGTFLADCLYE